MFDLTSQLFYFGGIRFRKNFRKRGFVMKLAGFGGHHELFGTAIPEVSICKFTRPPLTETGCRDFAVRRRLMSPEEKILQCLTLANAFDQV